MIINLIIVIAVIIIFVIFISYQIEAFADKNYTNTKEISPDYYSYNSYLPYDIISKNKNDVIYDFGNDELNELFRKKFKIDYTGNFSGTMTLPTLSDLDPRPRNSSPYSIHNLQLTYSTSEKLNFFCGVKNLLNWTPAKGLPFLIARSHDPFDKEVEYNTDGTILQTENNPYALTFDPTYVFAQNQGRRFFIGFRWNPVIKNKKQKSDK